MKRKKRSVKIHRDTARLLSQATYHQLVLALREAVANAHDANASRVKIDVELDQPGSGSLTVSDNGDGMTANHFENYFLKVGNTDKPRDRDRKDVRNRFGRKVIGQFGIGFIATVPFSQEVIIETKARDDDFVHGVKIDCVEILEGVGEGGESEFRFEGWDRSPDSDDPRKFTRVQLRNLTKQAYESLDASIRGGWYQTRAQRRQEITNEKRLDFLEAWLSRILPLGYPEDLENEELQEHLENFLDSDYKPCSIYLNGEQLERVMADAEFISKPFHLEGDEGDWSARGVLWSPQKSIKPVYARGVAIRSGDMAIGEPGYLGLNEIGRVYGKLQHITGEIQVEGLDHALQLDRQDFYFTPKTDEFIEKVRKQITSFEGALQKKAKVMQKFRNLKKSVDTGMSYRNPKPSIAPILEAPEEVQGLAKEAKEAGIRVEELDSDELQVPHGEREVRIGKRFAEQLLQVRLTDFVVDVEVHANEEPVTIEELVDSILDSPMERLKVEGPNVLVSDDSWALANVRLFVALRRQFDEDELSRDQIIRLLETLEESYRWEDED